MRDGMQKAMKSAEDLVAFNQGNLEAVTKSSQILATGLQDLTQTFAAAARASMDEAMSTFKAMSGVKSVKEAMDLQSKLVRSAMEKAVSQTSHVTDTSMKLSEQVLAPISARFSAGSREVQPHRLIPFSPQSRIRRPGHLAWAFSVCAPCLDARNCRQPFSGVPAFRYGRTMIETRGPDDPLMSDTDKRDGDSPGIGVVTKPRPKTRKPALYKVLMLNDDYTPMEFVVHVLERFFPKDP